MPKVNGFILKQIKEYETDYGYKLSGMKLALQFFHEIEGNSTEMDSSKYNAQGIGIVPFVYDSARSYFQKLYQTNHENSLIEYDNEVEVVYASPPKDRIKNRIDISKI